MTMPSRSRDIRAKSMLMGRGAVSRQVARDQAGQPESRLDGQLASLAAELRARPWLASLRREDGWQVGEILAHAADIAEVFSERLIPGSCPGATDTAVRHPDGRIDLKATNERIRLLRAGEPVSRSLERLARCAELARRVDPDARTHGARRIRDHSQEHLNEVAGILDVASRPSTRPDAH